MPTTTELALKFITDIPNNIKNINGGKGVPIEYGLCPLKALESDNLKAAQVL